MRANDEPKPNWRERYAQDIEAGKREWSEHVDHLDQKNAEYAQRLKEFKRTKSLCNGFKRDEPSHADLSLPKEDDDLW